MRSDEFRLERFDNMMSGHIGKAKGTILDNMIGAICQVNCSDLPSFFRLIWSPLTDLPYREQIFHSLHWPTIVSLLPSFQTDFITFENDFLSFSDRSLISWTVLSFFLERVLKLSDFTITEPIYNSSQTVEKPSCVNLRFLLDNSQFLFWTDLPLWLDII